MFIIAHRGIKKMEHENTIASFRKALEYEPDMIEFDVRKTRDEVLIIHHDEKINKKKINQMTWDEIQKHYQEKELTIPTFKEAMEFIKEAGTKADIELKEVGYERAVVKEIECILPNDMFVIKSFHDQSVMAIKKMAPGMKTGLLLRGVRHGYQLNWLNKNYYFEKRVKRAGVDFVAPHWTLVNKSFLKRAEKKQKPVYIWTVNTNEMIHRFLRTKNVFAIVTDHSDVAQEIKIHIEKTGGKKY